MTVRAEAPAKVNLALRIVRRDPSGLHVIRSLVQSIDWQDRLEALSAKEDDLVVVGADLPTGTGNLVWKALNLYREAAEKVIRLDLRLHKEIPTSAGLGGGSSDAAAALRVAEELVSGEVDLSELAPRVGADVPFCLKGGTAMVGGFGEVVDPIDPLAGFALGMVVPPVELATEAVYRAWDGLGGPTDEGISGRSLPPPLREHSPLPNDLYPAAVSLYPALDEWRSALRDAWDRPVMMSGSGPALFAYFADQEEVSDALRSTPPGARASAAAGPLPYGARITDR